MEYQAAERPLRGVEPAGGCADEIGDSNNQINYGFTKETTESQNQ
jgi:hypothetical protein